MTRVQILLFDGFDELDAIGPFEVLSRASRESDLEAELVTTGRATEVRAAYGLHLRVEDSFDPSRPPDVLLVPGGGWNSRSKQGAWAEHKRGAVPEAIARVHRAGTIVASVCTGAMLLAKAGILKGRPAATHHSARRELRAHGIEVVNDHRRVVDDGDVVTAGGVTSGLDLALHLVERFASADLARTIAEQMEYKR